MVEKRLIADAATMDTMTQLQRKKEKGEHKRREAQTGKVDVGREEEEEEAQMLWGMLYADNAGFGSRSPGGGLAG